MKRVLKVLSAICVVILLMASFWGVRSLFQRNHSGTFKYAEFWRDPSEYDVWFMGSSHTYHAFQPMEFWNSYGITSFDLAYPTCHLGQSYWTMMCALEEATPKLIVLDTYEMHLDKKVVDNSEKIHTNFDEVPFSQTKVDALMDLTDGDEDLVKEYCFPLGLRHHEWKNKEVSEIMSTKDVGPKGSTIKSGVEDRSFVNLLDKDEGIEEDNISMQYLRKIIEECEKRDIDLLIVCLPYYGHDNNQRGLNATYRIMEDYDVPFVDVRWDGIIDPSYDMADLNHVNLSGTMKLTEFFGKYLAEHYDLPDHRGEGSKTEKKWQHDFAEYQDYLTDRIRKNKDLNGCLVLMSGDYYKAQVYSEELPEEMTQKIIDNHDNISFTDREEAEEKLGHAVNGDTVVIIKDSASGDLIAVKEFREGKEITDEN